MTAANSGMEPSNVKVKVPINIGSPMTDKIAGGSAGGLSPKRAKTTDALAPTIRPAATARMNPPLR
jgi:hypothetical protein